MPIIVGAEGAIIVLAIGIMAAIIYARLVPEVLRAARYEQWSKRRAVLLTMVAPFTVAVWSYRLHKRNRGH